jgi:hypothetical protein
MADTIIMQGPGYTIAQTDHVGTAIPYGDIDRHDGQRNHGFFDLRDRPELAVAIPEAQDSLGMQAILRALNAPGSHLMSLGCERGIFPRDDATPGEPAYLCGSYIQVAYRDSALNTDPARFVALSKELLSRIKRSADHHVGFEMIVEPLRFFFGVHHCFVLVVKPMGFGNSEAAALAAWEYAAEEIARAVAGLPSELPSLPSSKDKSVEDNQGNENE